MSKFNFYESFIKDHALFSFTVQIVDDTLKQQLEENEKVSDERKEKFKRALFEAVEKAAEKGETNE